MPNPHLDLNQIDADLAEVRANIDHGEAEHNPWALQALRAADQLRTALSQVGTEDDPVAERLLRFVKRTHRRGDLHDADGFILCAECGKPHPCETFRSASGDPGWPRPAAEVLAEMTARPESAQTVHAIADGSVTTSCCGKIPFELSYASHRLTQDPDRVTCQGEATTSREG